MATVPFDKAAMRFQAKVMKLARDEFGGSCEGQEAQEFLDSLYASYVAAGPPADMIAWIREQLKSAFVSVGEPPKWIEDEPSWPYWGGRPMVFVGQLPLPKNAVTERRLTWGEVVYVFGAKEELQEGFQVHYTTVVQCEGVNGVGDR